MLDVTGLVFGDFGLYPKSLFEWVREVIGEITRVCIHVTVYHHKYNALFRGRKMGF